MLQPNHPELHRFGSAQSQGMRPDTSDERQPCSGDDEESREWQHLSVGTLDATSDRVKEAIQSPLGLAHRHVRYAVIDESKRDMRGEMAQVFRNRITRYFPLLLDALRSTDPTPVCAQRKRSPGLGEQWMWPRVI
jgi:hypothetical protein